MKDLLNKITSEQLLNKATELLQVAFSTKNIGLRYKLFHEANDIKKIVKIINKYEMIQQRENS